MRMALLASLLSLPLLAIACGDNDEADDEDDPRRAQIGGVAEAAVGAYASAGPATIFDYLSTEAVEQCSAEELAAALADEPVPTGFQELKAVDFDGDSARATITISTKDGEKDVDWTYVEEDGNWRISDMPGLQNCG